MLFDKLLQIKIKFHN